MITYINRGSNEEYIGIDINEKPDCGITVKNSDNKFPFEVLKSLLNNIELEAKLIITTGMVSLGITLYK